MVMGDCGFASVRVDGPRRLYSIEPAPLRQVDAWLSRFRGFWEHKLEALATEVARGKRERGGKPSEADTAARPAPKPRRRSRRA
jgi:hypothetical protein